MSVQHHLRCAVPLLQVWPQSGARGGAAGAPERRLRWHSARGAEMCPAVAWRFGSKSAARAGPGWTQQAGVER